MGCLAWVSGYGLDVIKRTTSKQGIRVSRRFGRLSRSPVGASEPGLYAVHHLMSHAVLSEMTTKTKAGALLTPFLSPRGRDDDAGAAAVLGSLSGNKSSSSSKKRRRMMSPPAEASPFSSSLHGKGEHERGSTGVKSRQGVDVDARSLTLGRVQPSPWEGCSRARRSRATRPLTRRRTWTSGSARMASAPCAVRAACCT